MNAPGQTPAEQTPAEVEDQYHNYTGNAIPWYVRFAWLLFWAFAIYYTVRYLFPALSIEIVSPP